MIQRASLCTPCESILQIVLWRAPDGWCAEPCINAHPVRWAGGNSDGEAPGGEPAALIITPTPTHLRGK
ncbi:hypothetical protein LMH87_011590 [Akanthomyces muscarius]|uniref:Uncharacterized protein n=1 Tax=Akanthomyces muscarius TaxID=2231603 RepID=A0A9W8ULA0_AKAMU|nr:hypothetical protein LMH87_011590 [Akanthomyces muscarius]KAJ4150860.1 hypothetical protein LMH87_011590 [Akanthomyces muscarius]